MSCQSAIFNHHGSGRHRHGQRGLHSERKLSSWGFPDKELRVAAQVGRFEDEGWRVRKNGSQFWANVVITALRDKRGELRGFAKLTHDLTERKQAEEQLRAAKEAAEEGSLAKSQFLANMSHEIRTPMKGVLGPIGLLLDSKLSWQQRELTEIARSSAETLLGIINDILDLSKIEVGKLDIEPIPFNLLMAVEETAGMMAARAEKKGIDLIVRYPPCRATSSAIRAASARCWPISSPTRSSSLRRAMS